MEALGAGLAIGIAALGGSIGIGILMAYAFTSIARQPDAMGKIRPLIFVGIAFVEACVLYALVISLILLSSGGGNEASAPEAANPPAVITTVTNLGE
jgi:F-type H+-transporting ATPase subunit c